jgi:hypothetical protein
VNKYSRTKVRRNNLAIRKIVKWQQNPRKVPEMSIEISCIRMRRSKYGYKTVEVKRGTDFTETGFFF